MRKLKLLVVTLMMTLMLASPAYAVAIVANIGGTVNINSFNENNTTKEDNDTTTLRDSVIL